MPSNATLGLRRWGAGRIGAAIADRRFCERVLVIELAGLGDNVHLIPALHLLREHWPGAELEVMVSDQNAPLFRLIPWVKHAWAYPWAGRPGIAENLRWMARLRTRHYAVAINTTGSDRSTFLTLGSGAGARVGRLPADGGPPGWRFAYTRIMNVPYYEEPMYVQKWKCLSALGFIGQAPRFDVCVPETLRREVGIAPDDEHRYIHLSPFTGHPKRELPLAQLVELVSALRSSYPDLRLCISCSALPREIFGLRELVRLLPEPPWKVFAGTLAADRLAAVIASAAIHLSGDTGTLHLARMTQTPAVAWFRHHRGEREWMPHGPIYRVVLADGGDESALHGITTAELLRHAHAVLAAGQITAARA